MRYCFISGFSQPASSLEVLGDNLEADSKIYNSPADLYPNYLENLNNIIKEKSTIISWSMGGTIALDFTANYPEKVENLVLISATSNYIKSKNNEIGISLQNLNALRHGIINSKEITLKRFISKFSKKNTNKFLDNALAQEQEVLIHNLDYFIRDNTENVKKINKKTLIFHDKDDRIVPLSHGQKLNNLLSNSKLFTSSNYGHILEEDNSRKIVNFINENL